MGAASSVVQGQHPKTPTVGAQAHPDQRRHQQYQQQRQRSSLTRMPPPVEIEASNTRLKAAQTPSMKGVPSTISAVAHGGGGAAYVSTPSHASRRSTGIISPEEKFRSLLQTDQPTDLVAGGGSGATTTPTIVVGHARHSSTSAVATGLLPKLAVKSQGATTPAAGGTSLKEDGHSVIPPSNGPSAFSPTSRDGTIRSQAQASTTSPVTSPSHQQQQQQQHQAPFRYRSRPNSPGSRQGSLPSLGSVASTSSVSSVSSVVSSNGTSLYGQFSAGSTASNSDATSPVSQSLPYTAPASAPASHRRLMTQPSISTAATRTATQEKWTIHAAAAAAPHANGDGIARRTLQPRGVVTPSARSGVASPAGERQASVEVAQTQSQQQPQPTSASHSVGRPTSARTAKPLAVTTTTTTISASMPVSASGTAAPNSPATTAATATTTANSANDDRPSGMVSPTTFMTIHSLYSEDNPEFVEYKKKWESMRDLQTALRKAGGISGGRSLLSPVNSRGNTRTHTREPSRAGSPRALSPTGAYYPRALSPTGGQFIGTGGMFARPTSSVGFHGSSSPPTGSMSPSSSGPLGSPTPADGVTSFDFPVLPTDDMGEEIATPCSPTPQSGPVYVHSGSLFAILVESNRNSPLPASPIPGYKVLTPSDSHGGSGTTSPMPGGDLGPSMMSTLGHGGGGIGHRRSRTSAHLTPTPGSPAQPSKQRLSSRSHSRRASQPNGPQQSSQPQQPPSAAANQEPVLTLPPPAMTTPTAATTATTMQTQAQAQVSQLAASGAQGDGKVEKDQWQHVERRLHGLAVSSATSSTPSPPPMLSSVHPSATLVVSRSASSSFSAQHAAAATTGGAPPQLGQSRSRITILPVSAVGSREMATTSVHSSGGSQGNSGLVSPSSGNGQSELVSPTSGSGRSVFAFSTGAVVGSRIASVAPVVSATGTGVSVASASLISGAPMSRNDSSSQLRPSRRNTANANAAAAALAAAMATK